MSDLWLIELTELLSEFSCAINSSRMFLKFGAGLRGDRITDGIASTRLFTERSSISILPDPLVSLSAGFGWFEIDQDPDACSLFTEILQLFLFARSLAWVLSSLDFSQCGSVTRWTVEAATDVDTSSRLMVLRGNVLTSGVAQSGADTDFLDRMIVAWDVVFRLRCRSDSRILSRGTSA